MSSLETKSDVIAQEFTLAGLKNYLETEIDMESYSDHAFYEVLEEFLLQLSLEVRKTADALSGCGINFFWAIHMEDAILDPHDVAGNYLFSDSSGKSYDGINAIIASIVYDMDIDNITSNYWRTKDLLKV